MLELRAVTQIRLQRQRLEHPHRQADPLHPRSPVRRQGDVEKAIELLQDPRPLEEKQAAVMQVGAITAMVAAHGRWSCCPKPMRWVAAFPGCKYEWW